MVAFSGIDQHDYTLLSILQFQFSSHLCQPTTMAFKHMLHCLILACILVMMIMGLIIHQEGLQGQVPEPLPTPPDAKGFAYEGDAEPAEVGGLLGLVIWLDRLFRRLVVMITRCSLEIFLD